MAEFFEMPQASPTMEVGTILSWQVKEGDKLSPQDVIAEVETDKAAMEIEVFDSTYMLKILAQEGDEVPAGQPIAILGPDPDEDISALLAAYQQRSQADSTAADTPAADTTAADTTAADTTAADTTAAGTAGTAQQQGTAPAPEVHGLPALSWQGQALDPAIMEARAVFGTDAGGDTAAAGKPRSSPAARRAARERGIDLASVRGTGPRGRITSDDVESFQPSAAPAASGPDRGSEQVRNSQMRKTIARRLKQAYLDAPTFFLTARLQCDALVDFRSQLKQAGVRVSYNDLVVKAVARALRDLPQVNASWGEQAITRHKDVHVGVAVAIDDGLITPVLRHADRRGLADLADDMRDLGLRARARKLEPHEYQGSTFTVSNLGMMDIEHFTAIINPPEAGILAVGAMQQEPVVVDGELVPRWQMRVTMTCDHRVIDGALGARFLQVVRRYIEAPALLAS